MEACRLRESVSGGLRSEAGSENCSCFLYLRRYIGMYLMHGFVNVSSMPLRLAIVKEQSFVEAIHPRKINSKTEIRITKLVLIRLSKGGRSPRDARATRKFSDGYHFGLCHGGLDQCRAECLSGEAFLAYRSAFSPLLKQFLLSPDCA